MLVLCLQPIQLLNYSVELAKPGRFPSGTTEIPFEMPLRAKGNRQLYETYHGVFVNIQVFLIRFSSCQPVLWLLCVKVSVLYVLREMILLLFC